MRSPVSKRPLRSIRVTPWRTPAWRPRLLRCASGLRQSRSSKTGSIARKKKPRLRWRLIQIWPKRTRPEPRWPATTSSTGIWRSTRATARSRNPSVGMPHLCRAAAFYHFGLLDRARAEIRLAMENNPMNRSEPLRYLGTTALLGGKFAEAESSLRSSQGSTISESGGTYLAQALYYQGKKTEGEEILTVVAASKSAQARRRAQAILAGYLAARNDHVKARALITDVLAGTYMDHHVAYGLGVAFAQLGDLTEARRWLTRAAAEGFPCYPWYERDPLMQPLKSDPAFQAFMKQLSNRFDANRARFGG